MAVEHFSQLGVLLILGFGVRLTRFRFDLIHYWTGCVSDVNDVTKNAVVIADIIDEYSIWYCMEYET